MTEPSREQLLEPGQDLGRIEELELQLKRLLELWTAQTSTVRVEPGEALLIGGVDTSGDNIDAALQAIADLRKATGISSVWLFAGDIDVQAVELKEQKHAMELELKLKSAQEHIADLEFVVGEGDPYVQDRQNLLDQRKQRVQVLQDRIAKVREIAEAASKPCAYDQTGVCTHEENMLDPAAVLAVLDGEDERDPLRDVVDVKWQVPGFDDDQGTSDA